MEENDKNPVLDRLIEFINSTGLSSTQFADTAGIPRPSLSQMLHGRNKSVNNQVLAKLNAAFPNLNILWLLFGQGDMLLNQNIEISERQNQGIFSLDDTQLPDNEEKTPQIDFEKNFAENRSDKSDANQGGLPGLNSIPLTLNESSDPNSSNDDSGSISFQPYQKKRIVNIIVYYDDNSFESFVPGHRK